MLTRNGHKEIKVLALPPVPTDGYACLAADSLLEVAVASLRPLSMIGSMSPSV